MKDLYSALRIEQTASNADIDASRSRTSGQDDAAAVLLDPGRRAVYDSAYNTLKTIGTLRHRLGMDVGDSVFIDKHPDFVPSLNQARNEARASESATGMEDAEKLFETVPAPGKGSGMGTGARMSFVLAVAVIVAASFYFLVIR